MAKNSGSKGGRGGSKQKQQSMTAFVADTGRGGRNPQGRGRGSGRGRGQGRGKPTPRRNAGTPSTASSLKGAAASVLQGAHAAAISALANNRFAALGFSDEPDDDELGTEEAKTNEIAPKSKPKSSPCRPRSKRKSQKDPSEMPAKVPKPGEGVDLASIATNLQDHERYVNDEEMSETLEDQFNKLDGKVQKDIQDIQEEGMEVDEVDGKPYANTAIYDSIHGEAILKQWMEKERFPVEMFESLTGTLAAERFSRWGLFAVCGWRSIFLDNAE